MTLPIAPPYAPMEATTVARIPEGPEWQYEPKWDGFRCLVFRDGDRVDLQSKACKPLARYFPDVVATVRALAPTRFTLDAEIVVPIAGRLSFDDLLLRIHPAASRVARLAAETPAELIVFDLLVDARGRDLTGRPLAERRPALERFAAAHFPTGPGARIHLSPAVTDPATAQRWLTESGADLDGVIAKRRDLAYTSGARTGMQKVKHLRTADCVVGGFRYASSGKVVSTLLLGLYGDGGLLHHVGHTSGLSDALRRKLTPELERLAQPPGFTGAAPGGPSRWSTERSTAWQPLRPVLVAEVQYDHFSGGRFRHGTRLLRFRPDKDASQCTFEQVRQPGAPLDLGVYA